MCIRDRVSTQSTWESKAEIREDILILQRYYDPNDRYEKSEEDPRLKVEKNVTEFVVNKIYGCQVIITNCSVVNQEVQILLEVPAGSIPINNIEYTKIQTINIGPFSTTTQQFFFYFPSIGTFPVTPSNVSKNGKVLAIAKAHTIEVGDKLQQQKLTNLTDILSKGSKSDIIEFVKTKNLLDRELFSFSSIYWLLKDKDFYSQFIDICRSRKFYDETTWSFSLLHGDIQTVREYLRDIQLDERTGVTLYYVNSSLFSVNKVRVLEYFPIVNSRAHLMPGEKTTILNREFREQYIHFLRVLTEKTQIAASDYLLLVYYLLLQDRIDDAIRTFAKIDRSQLENSNEAVLQYDYFAAYLDFFIGFPNFQIARKVSEQYIDYPVLAWRRLFIEIANQLAEYDGDEATEETNPDEKTTTQKKNTKGAAREESLSLELVAKTLVINYQNISSITVDFFEIDLEVLFSRNPFLLQDSEDFSMIKPTKSITLPVETSTLIEKTVVDIPEEFTKKNVFISVASSSRRATTTYLPSTLKVQIIENYGQVKVTDEEGHPLAKIYVKTFAKKSSDGSTIFYKDGYTDIRGRFDYASLNSGEISNFSRFSLFIMSDELGSVIKEANIPSQLGRYDDNLTLLSKKTQETQKVRLAEQEMNYKESKVNRKSKY
eukprot:TRINITY_DN3510_c0_g1_i2.p1 TRINITY_DN3510_c0_g1~~TRINITY_DN3510_c0_g1_i2.p1  ORF type:complete len:696 (+),score=188.42 TRINITY_DN3510_c0_g1_i2:115-2088(+)